MNDEELSSALLTEISELRNSRELRIVRAQMHAKRLGARISVQIDESQVWKWAFRLISNASIVFSIKDESLEIKAAFKDAAHLLELMSDTSLETDGEFARILAAFAYDIAGYQANSLCLMKRATSYSFKTLELDSEESCAKTHPANSILFSIKLFLEKKIAFAQVVKEKNQSLFIEKILNLLDRLYVHILTGKDTKYKDDLSAIYLKSFEQGDYVLNITLSLLVVRLEFYERRSLWNVLKGSGKDTGGLWGKYIRLKTNDLYEGMRLKPVDQRRSRFEFWDSQLAALNAGIISNNYSYAIQMPTSAGKTIIGELIALDSVLKSDSSKCLFIAPFKALANQLEDDLRKSLSPLGVSVSTVSGTFELDPLDDLVLSETDILVCTPEKVDMLTRLKSDYFNELSSVIIDEGHILGDAERGAQVELLLAKLRIRFPNLRIALISAVMPEANGKQLARWLSGDESKLIQAPKEEGGKAWQPTQKIFGFFKWDGSVGEIDYPEIVLNARVFKREVAFARGLADKKEIAYETPKKKSIKTRVFPSATHKGETSALLGFEFSKKGPTLVFTPRPDWVVSTASKLLDLLKGLELKGDEIPECFRHSQDLKSLGPAKEWYGEDSTEYYLLSRGIGIHHGRLPDALRKAVEDDFREERIRILFANSTVSQGINFPIKYLVVHSLVISKEDSNSEKISRRDFWNLVGRAGRAGHETEGQVIFVTEKKSDRSLYLDFLKQEKIESVESVFYQLAKLLVEKKVEVEKFRDIVSGISEASLLGLLIEDTIETPDQERIESLINHTLFNTQILLDEPCKPALDVIRTVFKGLPNRIESEVPDKKIRSVFKKTGLSLKSNQELYEFLKEASPEITEFINNDDIHGLIHRLVSFLLNSEINEASFDEASYFNALEDQNRFGIIDSWINGEAIGSIVNGTCKIDPHKFQKFLSQALTYRYPWVTSALMQIYAAVEGVEFEDLPERFRLLSTYIKFGVSNKNAALLLSLGVSSRPLAMRLSHLIPSAELKDALEWLRTVSYEELSSAGLDGSEIKHVFDVSHKISKSPKEDLDWVFEVKGISYSDTRKSIANLVQIGDLIRLERESNNEYDAFAIRVLDGNGSELGYVPRHIARLVAPMIDLEDFRISGAVIGKEDVYDWSRVRVKVSISR